VFSCLVHWKRVAPGKKPVGRLKDGKGEGYFPLLNGARQPPVKSFPGNPETRTLTYFRKKYLDLNFQIS